MNIDQKIIALRPGRSTTLSSGDGKRIVAERSGDGKQLRIIREHANGYDTLLHKRFN